MGANKAKIVEASGANEAPPPSTGDQEMAVIIERNDSDVIEAGQSPGERSSSPQKKKKKRPAQKNETSSSKRQRSESCSGPVVHVSDDEESVVDSHDDERSLSSAAPGVPRHVTAHAAFTKEPLPKALSCPIRSLTPTPSKAGGSGIFYDDAELPIASGNHPLMSDLSDASLLRVKVRSTAFLPLLACPRLPTARPPLRAQQPLQQQRQDAVLNGSRHVLTSEASRILQEEKMGRLRAYLARKEEAKRRRRRAENSPLGGTHKKQQQQPRAIASAAALVDALSRSQDDVPPPQSSPSDKSAGEQGNNKFMSSCSPDVLDAAMALTMCLSRAPALPRAGGPMKNATPAKVR